MVPGAVDTRGVRVYPYPRVRVGSGTGTTSTGTGIPDFHPYKEHDFFTILELSCVLFIARILHFISDEQQGYDSSVNTAEVKVSLSLSLSLSLFILDFSTSIS